MSSPSSKFTQALTKIDHAHSQDPRPTTTNPAISYELHYAQKMTTYLHKLSPNPSETLQLAIRAQHLRRWEVPRDTYPATKAGYHSWRSYLQTRQGEIVKSICLESGYNEDDAERVAALVRKEGLKKKEEDPETQVLEDVACLVFLDDRLEGFERDSGIDEEKMLEILRKSVAKMSDRGRALAGEVVEGLGERGRELVRRALEG